MNVSDSVGVLQSPHQDAHLSETLHYGQRHMD